MRLLKCRVENFGKLHEQEFSFLSGLNVTCQPNGWGKSTLVAFLKVMFYGFEGERIRDDFHNERKRYRPWQGGIYGGSVTFEVKGKTYIVTRTFGLKEKEDKFSLREADTNLESKSYSSNLGEELFRIDRASFERTVLISQNDCETSVTDRIHGKLGNLTDLTDDVNQYENADARLHHMLNAMSPDRKTGSLYQMKEEIAFLESEVRRRDQLQEEICRLEEQEIRMRARWEAEKRRQQQIQAVKENNLKMQALSLDKKALELEKEQLIATMVQGNVVPTSLKLTGAAGAVLIFAGGLTCIKYMIPGMIVAGLGCLLLAVFLAQMIKAKRQNQDQFHREEVELENLERQIEELDEKLAILNQKRSAFEGVSDSSMINESGLFADMKDSVMINQSDLFADVKDSVMINQSGLFLDKSNVPTMNERDIFRIEEQRRHMESRLEQIEEKESILCNLWETYYRDLIKYERLKLTKEYLSQAKAAFSMKYRNPLMESFSRYQRLLADYSAKTCHLDANIQLTVEEKGEQRKTDYFSEGWKDLFGLCLRLALVDTMYEGEKPFLVFDDPFLNLDDEKGRAGMELLKEMSEEYQILYFTCHRSRT